MNNTEYYLDLIEQSELNSKSFDIALESGDVESIQEGLFAKKMDINKQEWNTIKKDIMAIIKETYEGYIKYLETKTNKVGKTIDFLNGITPKSYEKKYKKTIEAVEKKLNKIEKSGKGSITRSLRFACNEITAKAIESVVFGSPTARKYFHSEGPLSTRFLTETTNYAATGKIVMIQTKNLTIL